MMAQQMRVDLGTSRSYASFASRSENDLGALNVMVSSSSAIVPPNGLIAGGLDCPPDSWSVANPMDDLINGLLGDAERPANSGLSLVSVD